MSVLVQRTVLVSDMPPRNLPGPPEPSTSLNSSTCQGKRFSKTSTGICGQLPLIAQTASLPSAKLRAPQPTGVRSQQQKNSPVFLSVPPNRKLLCEAPSVAAERSFSKGASAPITV